MKIDQSPIFILGHHRSGTTLLHKLISQDPQFCYFKNSDIIFPRLNTPGKKILKLFLTFIIRTFRIKTFAYNNVLFELDDPQEEDMCMTGMFEPDTFYWKFVFPNSRYDPLMVIEPEIANQKWKNTYSFYLKRVQYHNKSKKLLFKNPPNTARVKTLLEIFPNAKFIYINRDPYEIIYSTIRLWKKGLQVFSLQRYNDILIEDLVFKYFKAFHKKYISEKDFIPLANLIEVKYDDLKTDPLSVIKTIYHKFNLNFDTIEEPLLKQINKEKEYKVFKYQRKERLDNRIKLMLNEMTMSSLIIYN
ncbi:sulfotransferase family protein [Aestuariivivens sediminicola]|uniref:sulfotransferase family protein n=1 Tax=Aestuariivivens sediminicola TaxID=2913560 RepID=UPI001F58A08C|nr:sulfotransferase [Aestuariivivens sediminicola]